MCAERSVFVAVSVAVVVAVVVAVTYAMLEIRRDGMVGSLPRLSRQGDEGDETLRDCYPRSSRSKGPPSWLFSLWGARGGRGKRLVMRDTSR